MKTAKISLSVGADEAKEILEYCRRELILPEDLLRRAAGLKPNEPFLVSSPSPRLKSETSRMIAVLEDLWMKSPDNFAAAAEGIGGNSRLWFATDPNKIWNSGSSNKCAQIGNSPWWVSTNCPWNGMCARIEKIMFKMGFSSRYTTLVSGVVVSGSGSIWAGDYIK